MINDTTGDVVLRRYGETSTQFAARNFNYCMWQVGRCHNLQFERRRTNDKSAAIFYQGEAVTWQKRAWFHRDQYNAIVARELIELIPGTRVRWDDVFHIDRPFYLQQFGRGQRIGPTSFLYVKPIEYLSVGMHRVIPKLYDPEINAVNCVFPDKQFEVMQRRARKIVADPRWKSLPAQKYDNPRDVPLTLTEQMQDLIDGIGKRK